MLHDDAAATLLSLLRFGRWFRQANGVLGRDGSDGRSGFPRTLLSARRRARERRTLGYGGGELEFTLLIGR